MIRCRVVTRVRGEGQDHRGLGPGRDGGKTQDTLPPLRRMCRAWLEPESPQAGLANSRARERKRERETQASSIFIYMFI